MELTGKHRAFADARLAGKSNRDAAIAAGYSAKTAGPAGTRLAKRPDIAAFIANQRNGTSPPSAAPPPPARPSFDINLAITYSDPLDLQHFVGLVGNDHNTVVGMKINATK